MLHPARRLAVALATAAALTATAALPAAASARAAPRCGSFSLLGELQRPSAGAGSRFVTLVLTNVTRRSCSLNGFPGLRLLGSANAPLPTHVVHTGGSAHVVTLAPGGSARSALRFGAIAGPGEPTTSACEPTPARVRIAPPGGAHPFVIPWRLGPVCEHGTIDAKPLR